MVLEAKVCAVVPAAGRGRRAGLESPKILASVDEDRTVWSVLHERLRPVVDRIAVVLSPDGAPVFEREAPDSASVRICVQDEPLGMGDAVFRAGPAWEGCDAVLVVWGDQLGVSADTIARTVQAQRAAGERVVTLPMVEADAPYVQYDFDATGVLVGVRQSREGDVCDARGVSDVGCFGLSAGGLAEAWRDFVATGARGARSGELNFLPFLVFLAGRGWSVQRLDVADPVERRGVNTPDELAFFRDRFRK